MDVLDGRVIKLKQAHGYRNSNYLQLEGWFISRDWLIPA
jgi:hypothetical protein